MASSEEVTFQQAVESWFMAWLMGHRSLRGVVQACARGWTPSSEGSPRPPHP
ncbi:hypothetical protein [uncultured Ellagibacter sp.]|uniref:hypothetical protein n=1 Tax=uncultured Ellagibacter sp. TaxID=2137580 RepID=UPI0025DCF888|nr:hypothetical protein [uncultured Ellagibacter sp.]